VYDANVCIRVPCYSRLLSVCVANKKQHPSPHSIAKTHAITLKTLNLKPLLKHTPSHSNPQTSHIQENHHLSAGFKLLNDPFLHFMDCLARSDYQRLRKVWQPYVAWSRVFGLPTNCLLPWVACLLPWVACLLPWVACLLHWGACVNGLRTFSWVSAYGVIARISRGKGVANIKARSRDFQLPTKKEQRTAQVRE
jgi:hypothetical protein